MDTNYVDLSLKALLHLPVGCLHLLFGGRCGGGIGSGNGAVFEQGVLDALDLRAEILHPLAVDRCSGTHRCGAEVLQAGCDIRDGDGIVLSKIERHVGNIFLRKMVVQGQHDVLIRDGWLDGVQIGPLGYQGGRAGARLVLQLQGIHVVDIVQGIHAVRVSAKKNFRHFGSSFFYMKCRFTHWRCMECTLSNRMLHGWLRGTWDPDIAQRYGRLRFAVP